MIGVIVNPRSGYVSRHGVDHLKALVKETAPGAQIYILQQHDDVAARCREFLDRGAECIAAVGGDGTVNSVAACLVGKKVSLGVIPGGTLNHFARDVGVGRDVPAAVRTLTGGHTITVDVATVNDHIFLNNSSIGIYPEMVHLRESKEEEVGKMRAMMRAALLVLRQERWIQLHISSGDEAGEVRTRLLFVGNNQYELDPLRLGRRERLDGGILSCFVLDAPDRLRLVSTLFTSLRGDRSNHRFLRSLRVTDMMVAPRSEDRLEVSADGEVFTMKAPLVYRVVPKALHVVVPQQLVPH